MSLYARIADEAVDLIEGAVTIEYAALTAAGTLADLLDDADSTPAGKRARLVQARRVAAAYRDARARLQPDVWGAE